MKNFIVVGAVFYTLLVISSSGFSKALVDPRLRSFARNEAVGVQRVLVLFKPGAPVQKPRRYDKPNVVRYYRQASYNSIKPFLVDLQNNRLPGVKMVRAFWLNGSLIADVTPQGLRNLAEHSLITKIYKNGVTRLDQGVRGSEIPAYAFESIGLDRLVKEQPQITGQGVLLGAVDSGVDARHPALKEKVPLFFNGQTKKEGPPRDFEEHGTHVSGTMVGGDRKNLPIGVAPGAKLVVAGVIEQGDDDMIDGMQWFLDVEKNPQVANRIRVIGNSWNTKGSPDQEPFYRAIAAWEAAGILPVFSAGNEGKEGIDSPHEYPGAFTVAAYGPGDKIAEFSSVGPAKFQGKLVQKPDIAAPGVDIVSSVPHGKFASMSGTSMAQPHVSGATALLLQVNPNLNPAQLREIFLKTATPVRGQGRGQWLPTFGFGKLNVYDAVKAASSQRLESVGQFLSAMYLSPSDPSAIETDEFNQASLGEVDGEVDQFHETDSSQWLTADQLYGS